MDMNKNYWRIELCSDSIYVDGNADVDWDIDSWDEGWPEVYAITIDGVRLEFETEVTLYRKHPNRKTKEVPLPDPPTGDNYGYDTMEEKWEAQRYG